MMNMEICDGLAVFGVNECIYQCVLDDFKNAKFIGIMTFNISQWIDSELLQALRSACCNGTNAVIITNVPRRPYKVSESKYASAATNMHEFYKQQLNPEKYGMRLSPFFSAHNHAKIVMTDNIAYWGSSNFSDGSRKNIECGTISKDRKVINYLRESVFPDIQKQSISYYQYNFAVAIANIDDLIPVCQSARTQLFEAAFMPWEDYDTNFEEKWVYRTTDNELTVEFLQGFTQSFSQFDGALNVIEDIIDEYWKCDKLPEQVEVLKYIFEEYQHTYDRFYEVISLLFEDLKQMAQYDVSDEACKKIVNDYAMEAYDEELDRFADRAVIEAAEEYRELIQSLEPTVRGALDSLDLMIKYFEQLNTSLHQLLEVNPDIDNTGVK